jgi:hypothetical protein
MLTNTALKDKPKTQKRLATEIVDMPMQICTFPAAAAETGIITASALPCALLYCAAVLAYTASSIGRTSEIQLNYMTIITTLYRGIT